MAIIDTDQSTESLAAYWCAFLQQNGHPCTTFPTSGPTSPLDPFDVVIDMSEVWTDPGGELAAMMQTGKTVITQGYAPQALGIDSNPTVQAWIGADQFSGASGRMDTVTNDPILGSLPPGTAITDCSSSICTSLQGTAQHLQSTTLATFVQGVSAGRIGVMRNSWGHGFSAYLSNALVPDGDGPDAQIILNAVRIRQLIPTTSAWGSLILVLGVAITGTLILRQRGVSRYQVAGGTL